ncbi:MAG: ATP synthase F1 subunit epsilon [Paludibacteraceae bacterium]|nr:ATP synthase F1 subunit epsilon [Paludibacteraceae bacterium]
MNLIIISPEKMIYNGKVSAVSVPGKNGRFTVLHNHAAIISTLVKGSIDYKTEEGTSSLEISSGLVEVNKNNITICIEL